MTKMLESERRRMLEFSKLQERDGGSSGNRKQEARNAGMEYLDPSGTRPLP
jgi:hypothetical protein